LRAAVEHEPRPLYQIDLAHALATSYAWDEAIAIVDKLLASSADHPAAVIERGRLLADSGRITPTGSLGLEVHAQLVRIIAEGMRPPAEQQHGVSQGQVAYAQLALAHVDYARGEVNTAHDDISHAGEVGYDDQP